MSRRKIIKAQWGLQLGSSPLASTNSAYSASQMPNFNNIFQMNLNQVSLPGGYQSSLNQMYQDFERQKFNMGLKASTSTDPTVKKYGTKIVQDRIDSITDGVDDDVNIDTDPTDLLNDDIDYGKAFMKAGAQAGKAISGAIGGETGQAIGNIFSKGTGVIDNIKNLKALSTLEKGTKGLGKARGANAMAIVGAASDIIGGFMPEKTEYQGEEGDLTQTLDSVYSGISDAAMSLGPIGMIVGGAMKGADLLGKGFNALGGGTDGMTTQDAILGSSFFNWNIGLINGFGGKKADTITKDNLAFEQVGSSYLGSSSQIDDAVKKSGKKYGLFSSSALADANREIWEGRRQQSLISNIADEASDRFSIRESMAAINGNRRRLQMQGGYNQSAVRLGRHGLVIQYLQEAKRINSSAKYQKDTSSPQSFKEGGSLTKSDWLVEVDINDLPNEFIEAIIEEVDIDSLPQSFKEGGTLKAKSRTLEELIKFAKQKNPRFIQRLSEPVRDVDLGNGFRGTHLLSWGTTDNPNEAIVYPQIFENEKGELIYDPEHAFDNAKKGDALFMTPEEAELFTKEYKKGWPQFFDKFKEGGKFNLIPEGALHARKHNMEVEGITKKGIPVVSQTEDGEIEQQAEIEREEVILRLEVTKKLEELKNKYEDTGYSQEEKDQFAIEAGKLLTYELLQNTIDNTGLLNTI